jgi:hypothetical protein
MRYIYMHVYYLAANKYNLKRKRHVHLANLKQFFYKNTAFSGKNPPFRMRKFYFGK